MTIRHTILYLLNEGPKHGYALRQDLKMFRHFYPFNNINIYPLLKDLEDAGLVLSNTALVGWRHRKIYQITAEGTKKFEDWLAEPSESLQAGTDLVSLKMVLASKDRGTKLAWLEQSLGELDQEIRAWHAFLRKCGNTLPPLALLATEYRLRGFEDRRAYVAAAIELIRAEVDVADSTRVSQAEDTS